MIMNTLIKRSDSDHNFRLNYLINLRTQWLNSLVGPLAFTLPMMKLTLTIEYNFVKLTIGISSFALMIIYKQVKKNLIWYLTDGTN